MPPAAHVNSLPGCQKPTECRARLGFLCGKCIAAGPSVHFEPGAAAILRIELSTRRRRHLGDMARAEGIDADVFASLLLSHLIDERSAVSETEGGSGEAGGCGARGAITLSPTKEKRTT